MFNSFKHTVKACYIGYITQAIVNSFAPLLFLTFNKSFNIPLSQISLLITINFCTQIAVDFISAKFVDKIGYRASALLAHTMAAAGLICLGTLPFILPSAYAGIIISVVLYAIGGGITEVIISPIVEACPGDEKEAAMSLLHSFYCWGCVLVVVVSTILFRIFGIENWRYICFIWALVPIFNIFYFSFVPINKLVEDNESSSILDLLKSGKFWILVLLMFSAGASEQAMSQWASTFAEAGLKVNKTLGDLLGPCLFSVLMGLSRVFHSKVGSKYNIKKYLSLSAVLCIFSYLIAIFSPFPLLSLFGCGLCGLSVGAMWPGSFSISAKECPKGGTAMFALLALAGDLGCAGGPTVVGFVSSACENDLKKGLLCGMIFPVLLIFGILLLGKSKEK